MDTFTADQVHALVRDAFMRCNTSAANADSVATALVAAELAGQTGHGLRRVTSYCGQSLSGKVDGHATPSAEKPAAATLKIDAANGFAYPALDLMQAQLPAMARECGIAIAGISRSHHCGVAGVIMEKLANEGLVALMFANTPAAMAPWGGNKALFGTNPIAFAAPQSNGGGGAIVVDVSLSKVARGKIMAAKQKGEPIPEGWALGPDGEPVTDPNIALQGTMVPLGDAKGTALALMVELMAASLIGANTADKATSFFDAEGAPPGVGQTIIAIDPTKIGGAGAIDRFADMAASIAAQSGARVPGHRRQQLKQELLQNGIAVPADLRAEIEALGQ
ncbi:MAG: Ldh family oxidoreductase [Rhizobiaceae bacterium]